MNIKLISFMGMAVMSSNASAKVEIISVGSVVQMLLALIFVIGLIWGLNKFTSKQFMKLGGESLSIVSSVPVGQKERVILIDVEGERVLIGVSPGTVKFISKITAKPTFKDNLDAQSNAMESNGS